ncbi:MAG: aminotransferase class V-fold PLP-dependent enzyme, partial [Christensenella sp.]
MQKIYLDNAATTQPLDECNKVYLQYAQELWQNPSALYADATRVQKMVDDAKAVLLQAFGTAGHKCLFTSCGTESANTVILRGARQKKDMHYVCGGAEHPCVEESFRYLQEQGHPVTFIQPDRHGLITPIQVSQAVTEHTALVSIMHVNNETGAKNAIEKIAAAVKAKNPQALFHSDGVQAFGKERIANTTNIDYYTVSAHKLHAHKGTGAIFYKNNSPLKPFLMGGGQENGLRSGTQNTLGIFSFATAVQYFMKNVKHSHYERLKDVFLSICAKIPDVVLLTPAEQENACAHIVNVSLLGIRGETLLHMLEARGICISTGSACS